ncbi:hypothetical protein HPB50_009439 [Hyalomma asiaticum]|uniref:Uncharacterized protein n=1 Tax=Hyalomma asiaticum TaxID=266040 RepID=A0ACB7SMA9_HYAAI|nr:hypothetical protein HPB50_009439 [Hyalomma asiaticum]
MKGGQDISDLVEDTIPEGMNQPPQGEEHPASSAAAAAAPTKELALTTSKCASASSFHGPMEKCLANAVVFAKRQRGTTRRKPPDLISGDQLDILAEARDLLKPLEEATLTLSKGRSVTLSDVIPLVYGLKQGIQSFEPHHSDTFDLQQKLPSEIDKRFSRIEYLRPYAAAMILDPRYKNCDFEHPHTVAIII